MKVSYDDADVKRVFRALPEASLARLNQEIEGSAIDVQRSLRLEVNVGASGDLRRSIKYKMDRASFSAEIYADSPYADDLENGRGPRFVSVKVGSPLRKWADFKHINPWMVQASIKKKGTKAHPFVRPVFERAKVTVPRDIASGFGKFIREVNSGRI